MTASNDCDGQEPLSLGKFGEIILTQWFRFDQWKSKEAICLLCNIIPIQADIDWDFKPKGHTLGPPLVAVKNACLLTESPDFYEVPTEPTTAVDETQYSIFTIAEKAKKLKRTERQLQTVWSMFSRTSDFEFDGADSSSPTSYLKWAEEKGIAVSWLDWARRKGVVGNGDQSDVSYNAVASEFRPVTVREENTYLNIIGGMLNLMLSKSPLDKPNSIFKAQADVINALISDYRGNQGITKRTLEEKFAAAKRSIQRNG